MQKPFSLDLGTPMKPAAAAKSEIRHSQQLYHIMTMQTESEAPRELQRMKQPSGAQVWRQFHTVPPETPSDLIPWARKIELESCK